MRRRRRRSKIKGVKQLHLSSDFLFYELFILKGATLDRYVQRVTSDNNFMASVLSVPSTGLPGIELKPSGLSNKTLRLLSLTDGLVFY